MSTGIANSLAGTGMRQINIPLMSPQKSKLYNQTLEGVTPGVNETVQQLRSLAGGGNEEMWKQLEAPSLRQFSALQGNLASRFSGGFGQGGSGGRKSSGFQNYMGEQASSLSEQLQSQRMQYQQSAQDRLLSLYSDLMGTDEFDVYLANKQKKQAGWKSWVAGGLPIAGAIAGGLIPGLGPMGAAAGAQLGSSLGGAITGGSSQADYSGIGKLPTKWGT